LLLTNRPAPPARQVIHAYTPRMNDAQRHAEAIQSFGLDALAGTVSLSVDPDAVLSVLARTLGAALRPRPPGHPATTLPPTTPRAGSATPAGPSPTAAQRS